MNNTKNRRLRLVSHQTSTLRFVLLFAGFTLLLGSQIACQEFVHMGQISDGVSSWSIGDARIEQKQDDGTWKNLGTTDGNGRWWIPKEKICGGGTIRISKPGYHVKTISEADFLNDPNILMVPDESEGSGAGWRSAFRLRLRLLDA